MPVASGVLLKQDSTMLQNGCFPALPSVHSLLLLPLAFSSRKHFGPPTATLGMLVSLCVCIRVVIRVCVFVCACTYVRAFMYHGSLSCPTMQTQNVAFHTERKYANMLTADAPDTTAMPPF